MENSRYNIHAPPAMMKKAKVDAFVLERYLGVDLSDFNHLRIRDSLTVKDSNVTLIDCKFEGNSLDFIRVCWFGCIDFSWRIYLF